MNLSTYSLVMALSLWAFSVMAQEKDRTENEPGRAMMGEGMVVEGIGRRSDDEDPRVLNILPWQPPTLPKRPRTELNSEAPELLSPVDPHTLERHRKFRQNLDPDLDPAPFSR
ncbi:hypothetical protein [Marinobacter salicampi]|uniref:hypothetical protein n=1 Tax=Marinobacter salicampi TaxID=435907 RepID=UPI0014074042|nr:hypothetical protein [Marinobacter salicampi]